MKAFVIERRSGEHRDGLGWAPTAATEDGDEARRLADMWSARGDEFFRAVRYSETTKARVHNGLWLVVLQGGKIMWANDLDTARGVSAQVAGSRVAAFEPSLT